MEAINRFMNRVKAAAQSRSKDVRIPVEEAQELTAAIGELLAARVNQLQSAPQSQAPTEIKMDGGSSLKPRK